MPLNSLEHCICTTTMTNIRPDLVEPGTLRLQAPVDTNEPSGPTPIRENIKFNSMESCTSGLTHIKKTMKIYVIDSNNLINIRVSNSGLDHFVTDFVTFLC